MTNTSSNSGLSHGAIGGIVGGVIGGIVALAIVIILLRTKRSNAAVNYVSELQERRYPDTEDLSAKNQGGGEAEEYITQERPGGRLNL
jgi:hypothetical protein